MWNFLEDIAERIREAISDILGFLADRLRDLAESIRDTADQIADVADRLRTERIEALESATEEIEYSLEQAEQAVEEEETLEVEELGVQEIAEEIEDAIEEAERTMEEVTEEIEQAITEIEEEFLIEGYHHAVEKLEVLIPEFWELDNDDREALIHLEILIGFRESPNPATDKLRESGPPRDMLNYVLDLPYHLYRIVFYAVWNNGVVEIWEGKTELEAE